MDVLRRSNAALPGQLVLIFDNKKSTVMGGDDNAKTVKTTEWDWKEARLCTDHNLKLEFKWNMVFG